MVNYIVFRVYEFFSRKTLDQAMNKTISFISLLQISLLVPMFIPFMKMSFFLENKLDGRSKYIFAIIVGLTLVFLNRIWIKKKLSGNRLKEIERKYKKEKYTLPIWMIFILPVLFVFGTPIIYGAINGTLSFPIFEK